MKGDAVRLEGKVAIITGAALGMGAVEARLFAREGAKVVVADVREEEGRQVEAQVAEAGGEAVFIRLDVSSEEEWKAAVGATVTRFGKLDVLVNNAGILPTFDPGLDVEAWDIMMSVNAKGTFLGMKHAIPEMRKAGGGAIVNISSMSGNVGQEGIHPGYNASKGAVRILTKAAAVQYAKEGIRVNSVHPGVMVPMSTAPPGAAELRKEILPKIPMGRQGRREEVAYGVLFLASDESSYVTGAELAIDGGYTAQ